MAAAVVPPTIRLLGSSCGPRPAFFGRGCGDYDDDGYDFSDCSDWMTDHRDHWIESAADHYEATACRGSLTGAAATSGRHMVRAKHARSIVVGQAKRQAHKARTGRNSKKEKIRQKKEDAKKTRVMEQCLQSKLFALGGGIRSGSSRTSYPPAGYRPVNHHRHHQHGGVPRSQMTLEELLYELQHREITPEDYELLLQLQPVVGPATAGTEAVEALETVQVPCGVSAAAASAGGAMAEAGHAVDGVEDGLPGMYTATFDALGFKQAAPGSMYRAVFRALGFQLASLTGKEKTVDIYAAHEDDAEIGGIAGASFAEVGGEARCAICLEDYQAGDTLRRLPECGHCFHSECIAQWLTSYSDLCPIDRIPIKKRAKGETGEEEESKEESDLLEESKDGRP